MPRFSQWTIRLSFGYLLLGFTVGGLLLIHKGVPFYAPLWGWLPAHMEFLLVGWIVQFVLGVAFWIFPRLRPGPRRGNVPLAVASIVMLNAGIWLVVGGTTWRGPAALLITGRFLQVAAAVTFMAAQWARVMPFPEE